MTLELDPGRAALGNPRLIAAMIDEMAGGAIPFERYMEMALYHPEHGYYRRPGRIGRQGDFLTSPVIHPLFGWVVAAWCREVWDRLGRPAKFTILEPGAGTGAMASSVLDWADGRDDGFGEALEYVAVDPNGTGADSRVTWARPPIGPIEAGVIVSNELFDALPVRVFESSGRGPVEVYVGWDGERFIETQGPVASIDDAPEGGRFEVNPRAYPLMADLCSLVGRGAVLTFDYGYPQDELWAPWRTRGTLLCFYRHTSHEDPYIHVGEQDMTTHVNFSELASAAEDAGMAVAGPVSQAEFLYACGAGTLVEQARSEMAEYFERRRALEQLADAAGLGRVRVLAATRGVDGPLPGFEGGAG
ncbi:MAG TPA: SAM-dependent methyltransferase [Tepidiformaceae bacterium]|nr:SAM-dependent methyltransferase [Tepidiformaceae bacterium]